MSEEEKTEDNGNDVSLDSTVEIEVVPPPSEDAQSDHNEEDN